MKKLHFLATFLLIGLSFAGCHKDETGDKEKIVVMTIYPDTGYGANIMSDIITQPLVFSDSEDTQKRLLIDILTEGFDFEYKRGYTYTLKVKKIWMQEPPQDVASVKYVLLDILSIQKIITNDTESDIELFVSSATVKFTPQYPSEYLENQSLKIYDALHVKETGTNNWMALTNIEGFTFEAGYEYVLTVKKITQAEPYSVKYVLTSIVSKTKKI